MPEGGLLAARVPPRARRNPKEHSLPDSGGRSAMLVLLFLAELLSARMALCHRCCHRTLAILWKTADNPECLELPRVNCE